MKITKKICMFTLLILLLSLPLVSCNDSKSAKSNEKPIQIALTQDILSFDPMQTSDIYSEAVLRCVYTSLFDLDDDLNLRPKLAKTATPIDDYTWEIEIQDNVKFQNGTDLTAEDVVFTINRARKGGRTEKLLEPIKTVKKVSDTIIRITTAEPCPNLPTLFVKAETSIVSKAVVEEEGYDFSVPVGAGPYKLLAREENKSIQLERFDDYYLDKASSQYLNFLVIVTEQDRTSAFLNGDVDLLFNVSAYDCDKLKMSKDVNLLQLPSTKIEYLSLNNQHAPFDNEKVRLAISYAIDRERIVKEVYHGYGTVSSSLIPEGITGYVKSPITYDPQYAKQLLKEAGFEDGFEFTVITIDTIRKNTLEYIKLDLAEIGIELKYNIVSMKEAADTMMAGEHHAILVGWAFSTDPSSVLSVLLGSGSGKTMNSSNYNNPEVDQLLQLVQTTKSDDEKANIYKKINRIVTEDAPIVVLQNPMVLSAARSDIKGIHFNRQGLIQYESLHRK